MIFQDFPHAKFFMFISSSNNTVFLVQFRIKVHFRAFQKTEIAFTEAARAIPPFRKLTRAN